MMKHDLLESQLEAYMNSYWCDSSSALLEWQPLQQTECAKKILKFVQSTPDCFKREHLSGHITGSAFIIDFDSRKALLNHHKKLDKWLQFGGHSDGDTHTFRVAWREAWEESGLTCLVPLSINPDLMLPFDLDIHLIPGRLNEPEHLHYDIRYLFAATTQKPLEESSESNELRWVSYPDACRLTSEPSMTRQFFKTLAMIDRADVPAPFQPLNPNIAGQILTNLGEHIL